MTEIHDPLNGIACDFFRNVMKDILLNSILLFLNVAFSLADQKFSNLKLNFH